MKKILVATFALAIVAGTAGTASAATTRAEAATISQVKRDPADSLYKVARQLITSREYRRAADVLQQLVTRYPQSKSAGDALYWRAWSLYQLGRDGRNLSDLDAARASLDRYNANYGKSGRAASDATELYANIRAAQASLGDADAARQLAAAADTLRQQPKCSGSAADEEMRMAALDGLLTMPAEDAVPILRQVLKQRDDCRAELRKKAVFLLSQKHPADITATLLDVARNDPSNDVRGDAIFWLSQAQSGAAVAALDSIVFQSRDDELRKKALFALSQQSRSETARAAMRRAAESETLPEDVRGQAIFWLGQSNTVDLDYFKTLFRKTKSDDAQKKILFAVSQHSSPEATAWLLDVARDKTFDADLRKNAIFQLGQRRSTTMDMLQSLYTGAKGDDDVQKQVIFVYSQRSEPAAMDKLMDIAKHDPSVEMRKQALFWLGQKNDPRARQFLLDIIKQ
ncbi:MAG TPA: HEAT repeat domain-containing protein [Gemmatimonadaceae bacterium]